MYNDNIEVDIDKIYPNRNEEGAIIPLCNDKLFKKVFANKNNLKPLEELLSIYLPMDINDLRGNVSLTSNEPAVEQKKSKKRVLDVIAEIRMPNHKRSVINIEVNLKSSTVIRNVGYETKIYSNEIEEGEDYEDIPQVIQLCFDYFEVNKFNNNIEKKFWLKDETGFVLAPNLEVRHINIEKASKLWYSKNVNGTGENNLIVQASAMLTLKYIQDLKECLEALPMEEETKRYIEESTIEYSQDNKSWLLVDEEKEKLKLQKTELSMARKAGLKQGIEEGIEKGIEQGIEQGQKSEKISIAKNMLADNIPIEQISKFTGLSKEELKNIQ